MTFPLFHRHAPLPWTAAEINLWWLWDSGGNWGEIASVGFRHKTQLSWHPDKLSGFTSKWTGTEFACRSFCGLNTRFPRMLIDDIVAKATFHFSLCYADQYGGSIAKEGKSSSLTGVMHVALLWCVWRNIPDVMTMGNLQVVQVKRNVLKAQ